MGLQEKRVTKLFHSYVNGRLDEFLQGCHEELVVTAHDANPLPRTLIKCDIPDWLGSLQALSATTVQSSVEVLRIGDSSATVLFRHSIDRAGISRQLDMVNFVTFQEDLMVTWSSYPVDLHEYSKVWQKYYASAHLAVLAST
jgi:ketosteroid isomerase-like protein